jgi:hypothetical protein
MATVARQYWIDMDLLLLVVVEYFHQSSIIVFSVGKTGSLQK